MQDAHPLLARAADIEAALKALADVEPCFMRTTEKREALTTLARLESRLASLRFRLAAASEDVADVEGARDLASWLTHQTNADRGETGRQVRLARSLERWTLVGRGLAEGAINVEQSQVIVAALDALPEQVGPEICERAEAHLVDQAETFGPRELRILGRRVLDVVAPELGEEHERRALEVEEARAHRRTCLTTHRNGDGTTIVRALVPDAVAERLSGCLAAYTSPRRDDGSTAGSALRPADGERVPYAVRLGRAFCSLLEHLDPVRLPLHGGDATTLMVTIDLQSLRDGLGTAVTDSGEKVSATEARRLACTAGLVPAVLGTAGEVLDLGRASRLFSRAQRRAMRSRDRRCRTVGCDIPAAWCEAHHASQPWGRGGATDLADGQLLCSFHHHRAHDDGYLQTRLPNGDVRFHRRR